MNTFKIPKKVTINGQTFRTEHFVNKAGIRRVIPISLPKKQVVPFQYNRELVGTKVDQIRKNVITKKENFRSFPIFLANKDGVHETYDAHHLYPAELSQPDEMISCFICWWVDPNDDKQKLEMVRRFNSDQTSWKLWDYIKSNSDVEGGVYTYLKSKIRPSISYLTANVIASAYTGETRFDAYHPLKKGGLELTPLQMRFGDWFISKIESMRNHAWASNLNSYTLRYFASLLYETVQTFSKDINDPTFRQFGDALFAQITILAKNDELKKLNQVGCMEQYDELKNGILVHSVLNPAA